MDNEVPGTDSRSEREFTSGYNKKAIIAIVAIVLLFTPLKLLGLLLLIPSLIWFSDALSKRRKYNNHLRQINKPRPATSVNETAFGVKAEPVPTPVISNVYTVPTNEIGYDQDYQELDDPPHIIRIKQKAPKGLPKKFAYDIQVAGISRSPYSFHAESFIKGVNRLLELERDPNNQNDPNAIKVMGTWTDSDGQIHNEQLGWVPATIAQNIALEISGEPIGATIKTMFIPTEDRSLGLRMDIWCKRSKTKRALA